MFNIRNLFKTDKCPECEGRGIVLYKYTAIRGYPMDSFLREHYRECNICKGSGKSPSRNL